MSISIRKPEQIADFTNKALKELLGETAIVKEDLSNIYDIGQALSSAELKRNLITNILVQIGEVTFDDRKYNGSTIDIYRNNFEYGGITERVYGELDEAEDNDTWNITEGSSNDPFQNKNLPKVECKLYDKDVTYQIVKSIPDTQLTDAFQNAIQYGSFISMIFTRIENGLALRNEKLILGCVANGIGETLNANKSAYNLLAEYKDIHTGSSLTSADCLEDKDFLKYCAFRMKSISNDLTKYSVLFNVNGYKTFTPKDLQHFVLISDVAEKFNINLNSDVFHNELVKLPHYEEVVCWQGIGTADTLVDKTTINIETTSGDTISQTYVIGCIFDEYACGITNYREKVSSIYNPADDVTHYWFKRKARYFNDLNMNFVVFYIAD